MARSVVARAVAGAGVVTLLVAGAGACGVSAGDDTGIPSTGHSRCRGARSPSTPMRHQPSA
ncbi:hypothetical protein SALBM311S_00765 [Streptomyces alboniger]